MQQPPPTGGWPPPPTGYGTAPPNVNAAYGYPPQAYGVPPPQGFIPPTQGFAPVPPQGYVIPPQGYLPPQYPAGVAPPPVFDPNMGVPPPMGWGAPPFAPPMGTPPPLYPVDPMIAQPLVGITPDPNQPPSKTPTPQPVVAESKPFSHRPAPSVPPKSTPPTSTPSSTPSTQPSKSTPRSDSSSGTLQHRQAPPIPQNQKQSLQAATTPAPTSNSSSSLTQQRPAPPRPAPLQRLPLSKDEQSQGGSAGEGLRQSSERAVSPRPQPPERSDSLKQASERPISPRPQPPERSDSLKQASERPISPRPQQSDQEKTVQPTKPTEQTPQRALIGQRGETRPSSATPPTTATTAPPKAAPPEKSSVVETQSKEPEAPKEHDWKNVHFNKPTWCDICDAFIWGIGKQGYECQVCKVASHPQCRKSKDAAICEGVVDTKGHDFKKKPFDKKKKITCSKCNLPFGEEKAYFKCKLCKKSVHTKCRLELLACERNTKYQSSLTQSNEKAIVPKKAAAKAPPTCPPDDYTELLPDYLLLNIFVYAMDDIESLALVCKRWYELARGLLDPDALHLLWATEEGKGVESYFMDLETMERIHDPINLNTNKIAPAPARMGSSVISKQTPKAPPRTNVKASPSPQRSNLADSSAPSSSSSSLTSSGTKPTTVKGQELLVILHPNSQTVFLQVGDITCPLIREQPTLRVTEELSLRLSYLLPLPASIVVQQLEEQKMAEEEAKKVAEGGDAESTTDEKSKDDKPKDDKPKDEKLKSKIVALAIVMPLGLVSTSDSIIAFETLLAAFTQFSSDSDETGDRIQAEDKVKAAKAIERGGYKLRSSIISGAEKLGAGMIKTSDFINTRIITQNKKQTKVSAKTLKRIELIRSGGGKVLDVSRNVLHTVNFGYKTAATVVSTAVNKSSIVKKATSGKPGAIGQVGQAGLGAVLGVYYGVRDGARIIAESAKTASVKTIQHKYGDEAAYAFQEAMNSLRDVGLAAWYGYQVFGTSAMEMAVTEALETVDHMLSITEWLSGRIIKQGPIRHKFLFAVKGKWYDRWLILAENALIVFFSEQHYLETKAEIDAFREANPEETVKAAMEANKNKKLLSKLATKAGGGPKTPAVDAPTPAPIDEKSLSKEDLKKLKAEEKKLQEQKKAQEKKELKEKKEQEKLDAQLRKERNKEEMKANQEKQEKLAKRMAMNMWLLHAAMALEEIDHCKKDDEEIDVTEKHKEKCVFRCATRDDMCHFFAAESEEVMQDWIKAISDCSTAKKESFRHDDTAVTNPNSNKIAKGAQFDLKLHTPDDLAMPETLKEKKAASQKKKLLSDK